MLAKYWKKFLLAICIIACIYNIMSKLVNRASLEANLEKANDGNTVFDFSSKNSNGNTSDIIEGVVSKNVTSNSSTVTVNNEVAEDESDEENDVVEVDETDAVEENENSDETTTEEENETEENKSTSVKFTDFIFNW